MAVVLGSATAFADPDPTRVPLANAVEKNTENSAKNPQARGLQNAREHLLENARRQQEKRANHPPGQQKKAAGGATGTGEIVAGGPDNRRAGPVGPGGGAEPAEPSRP